MATTQSQQSRSSLNIAREITTARQQQGIASNALMRMGNSLAVISSALESPPRTHHRTKSRTPKGQGTKGPKVVKSREPKAA